MRAARYVQHAAHLVHLPANRGRLPFAVVRRRLQWLLHHLPASLSTTAQPRALASSSTGANSTRAFTPTFTYSRTAPFTHAGSSACAASSFAASSFATPNSATSHSAAAATAT